MQNTTSKIKNKHDHKLTNYLKAAIFCLVMLAPIFSIAVRCGYVMFNKNAYKSYYGETINEKIETNVNYNNLVINETYYFLNPLNQNFTTDYGTNNYIYVTECENLNGFDSNRDISNTYRIRLYITETSNAMNFLDINGNSLASFNMYLNIANFKFKYLGFEPQVNENVLSNYNYFYSVSYNNYSYLDNALTYGISNLKNETVFNWTQNTAIYTPIHAMTTGLGITEDAIAIMLTYWALMTGIYIVFDIVIVIFTKITHFMQDNT